MRSSVLASSRFGKLYPASNHNLQTVQFAAGGPIEQLQFTITADRLYLLDNQGSLSCLALADNSLSSLPHAKLAHFTIQTTNCFSICAVGSNSDLLKISLQNRKSTRVSALGLTRALSFQKNHLTNLLLVVDFQLILLLDANTGHRVAALKASQRETFSCGRFLDQNRFIVVALRGSELRVVEILGMRTVQRITLPFQIKNIKLETTLDGSTVAVGDSNVLLLVKVSPYGKLSYQMAELPLKGILCARFTHQNDLILLGNDRVIYGIVKDTHRLVQLFNPQQKLRISCFDVSLNTNTIALAAGKTLHLLSLPKGVRKALQESQGILLQFAQQGMGQSCLRVERDIEDEQDKNRANSVIQSLELPLPSSLPNFSENNNDLQAEVLELKASPTQQKTINSIYFHLHQLDSSRRLVHLHKAEVVAFIHRLLSLIKDGNKTAAAAYYLLTQLGSCISDGSLDKFALILAPRVFERIQKAQGQFSEFAGKNVLNLFSDYLSEENQRQVLSALVKNCHRDNFLPIFLLTLFLQMRANSPTWPLPHEQTINLAQILAETNNLMQNQRHAYIFAREADKEQGKQEEQLELLLARQEELKRSLERMRLQRQ